MKHRILLAVSFLLLLAAATQAKRIAVIPNSFLVRLDAIYRLVSTGTSLADGTRSNLLGKKLSYGQYGPKQKMVGATTERYTWSKSAGRWGYTAELGRFSSAELTQRQALQNKALRELDRWAERRGVTPTDLSNTASRGNDQTLWVYNDEETKTLVTLMSRRNAKLKKTAVVLRVEAM